MKSGIDEKTKQKIVALISALIPKAKIYLFGSRVRGKHSQWSDIDLAIDTGEKVSHLIVGEVIGVLAGSDIPYKIEVVDFHSVSKEMQQSILDERILWKK